MPKTILFIHPNFPGQFLHIARHLVASGNEVIAIGDATNLKRQSTLVPGAKLLGCKIPTSSEKAHHHIRALEQNTLHAQATLHACIALQKKGVRPDVIAAHTGWGDTIFLREVFPDARICGYFEFFFRTSGADIGFDPEFPHTLDNRLEIRMKNATPLLAWLDCDARWTPTLWQASLFPPELRRNLIIQHEGIDTQTIRPAPAVKIQLPGGTRLQSGDEVLTFVNRGMEPYRGLHIFLRALPKILRNRPNAQVLVIGRQNETPYGNSPADGSTWLDRLLREQDGKIDLTRVHFLGRIKHEALVKILQLSSTHVYLTYPYFLSWSMLEAMSAGCLLVASNTAPVTEFVEEGKNGLLVDFFDHKALAGRVCETLAEPEKFRKIRDSARQTVLDRLDRDTVCMPALLKILGAA